MAKFNSLEMAPTLSGDPRVSIKKSFFGTKVVYGQTESKIQFFKKEYTAEVGKSIEIFLKNSLSEIAQKAKGKEKFESTGLGSYLLEGGLSEDAEFAAFRLYHYSQLRYNPVTEILVFEGESAKLVGQLF